MNKCHEADVLKQLDRVMCWGTTTKGSTHTKQLAQLETRKQCTAQQSNIELC